MRGAACENGVLCPKDTALGAASVLEGLLANISSLSRHPRDKALIYCRHLEFCANFSRTEKCYLV